MKPERKWIKIFWKLSIKHVKFGAEAGVKIVLVFKALLDFDVMLFDFGIVPITEAAPGIRITSDLSDIIVF